MTIRKYEFVADDATEIAGIILTRIRALIDIPGICKAGDLGGYIEKEENLSHEGRCWVADDAWVFGDAKVYGDAFVYEDAEVSGNVHIYGDAGVFGNTQVSGYAWIFGNARIYEDAEVYGDAQVFGNTRVYGDAQVYGNARICIDAEISEIHHVVWFSNVGTENGTLTVFKTKDGVGVTRGCFTGTPEEFLTASKEKHNTRVHEAYKSLISVGVDRVMYGNTPLIVSEVN